MSSKKFTAFNKQVLNNNKCKGTSHYTDILTDDDDFCESESPLPKKPKTTVYTKIENKTQTQSDSSKIKKAPSNRSKSTSRKGQLKLTQFAKCLRDQMSNNSFENNNQDDDCSITYSNFDLTDVTPVSKTTQAPQQSCTPSPNITNRSITTPIISADKKKEPIADIPSNDENFFGLPAKVKSLFWAHRSISDLYEWQKKCLEMECKSPGSNLIYSLPTSGGKTLVAEILMMKQIICKQKSTLFILPFVAIVQEKIKSLAPFGVDLNFLVEEYAGSKGKLPPVKHRRRSIYVATIEKAASLVNSLIENNRLDELGLVVVDELHMIGEESPRGSTLESTLTKIMFSCSSTQLAGMSATLSNIDDLKEFLNAQLYADNFRPVELKEHVKVLDGIYTVDNQAEEKLEFVKFVSFKDLYTKESQKMDPDHLLGLVMEVVPKDSCLIFCATKKICENVAQLLCNLMPSSMKVTKSQERMELIKNLRADGGVACPILERTVMFGVAYHHSGLTSEERKQIEEAYLEGVICVITCTSTLAAGVNLPAKRVILRSPYVGCEFMSRTQYKQMVGRAGRAGFHSSGESFLIAGNEDRTRTLALLGNESEECRSSLLHVGSKGLSSMILSAIGLKLVHNTREMAKFLRRTLCHIQLYKTKNVDLTAEANSCLKELIDEGYIAQKVLSDDITKAQLDVTKLGRAIFKGSIDPKLGKKLYTDLNLSLSSLVLSSHLHLLNIVTPYENIGYTEVNWMTFLNETYNLSPEDIKLMSMLGISETYLHRKASGMSLRNVDVKVEEAAKRFYLTLMLSILLKKESVWEVASKFQVTRGFVQNLLSSSATFASSVLHFCQELEDMWPYQQLLPNFIKKLSYCCSMELIPLLEIPGVKIGRARLLYSAGYTTAQQIAQTIPEQLVRNVQPMSRKVAKQIISSAQMLVKEKLEDLMHEVQELIPIPAIGSQLDVSNNSFFNDTLDIINISQL